MRYLLLFISFAIIIISCNKDVLPIKVTPVTLCDTVNSDYTTDISPLINNSCNLSGCHGMGSSNGDFTTYNGVKAKVNSGAFENRVITIKDMPPGGLPDSSFYKLKCWIERGAPQ